MKHTEGKWQGNENSIMSDITEKCYNSLLNDISPDAGRDTIPKHYYSIGEVAELLGVPTSAIRFWEKHFKGLRPKKTNSQGFRRYSVKNLQFIQRVHHLLRVELYTIKGAKRRIHNSKKTFEEKAKEIGEIFKSKES